VGEAILLGFVVEYLGEVRPDLLALREVGGD
jgi:hypothetical protein